MDGQSTQDTGGDAVRLLREASAALTALHARFAARHGMHPTDVRALAWLLDARRAGTPVTAGLLGSRLGLNSAGTTALIDRLELLGHVRRLPDRQDRRRVLIDLEQRAAALAAAVHAPLLDRSAELAEEYDDEQLGAVQRFLTAVLAAARGAADPSSTPTNTPTGRSPAPARRTTG
jgi:DNA-binding MarR family transcriptional regulator